MPDSNETQIQQLQSVIAALEGQRPLLGDAAVEAALAPLREKLATLQVPPALPSALAEQRRILTILFTDVVGSTSFAEKIDPEEWRQTIARLHATVGDIIGRNGGRVAQFLGDGLLAFFGADSPSERDSENAIRAALDAQAAVPALDALHKVQIRIGIHTGLVVVGELGSEVKKEFTATGDAMNLAARLQAAAPPGGILISHETYRYVRGIFDVTPQPPILLKGKSEPVRTYLVRRAKARPFRQVTRGVMGADSTTVGREREFKSLREAYLEAFEQQHLVWAQLLGEPGVGKSRLLRDLNDWIDLRPETVRLLRARAALSDENQPYALIRRLWFDRFQIAEDAPLAQAEAKWVNKFKELWGPAEIESEVEERAHALGLLLGLPFQSSPYIGAMRDDPAQVRGRALFVSRELLERIRTTDPVVMLLEDLQWADASSWDYILNVAITSEASAEHQDTLQGVFVLATARTEWQPPEGLTREASALPARSLSSAAKYIQIELGPLGEAAMRELVTQLLQWVEAVPEPVVQDLIERAEGVPYFAEELVNWFIDRGIIDQTVTSWRFVPQRLKESPLPVTLQHLLLTRLLNLSEVERAALQRGAIFGRHFWSGGIESLGVHGSDQVLAPLQPRGLVEPLPESAFEGEQEWSFHHNLLRDVTYESVLKRERATLHRAAGKWLEDQANRAGRLDEFAGLIGEHLERAGDLSGAAEWYLRAGESAEASSALSEAKRFFDRALELLPPVHRERRWRALLGRETVLDVRGEREAQKADIEGLLELADKLDDKGRQAEAAFRRARYFRTVGDYRAAVQAGEQAIAAARRAGNRALEVRALAELPLILARLGEREAARQRAEETLALVSGVEDNATVAQALARLAGHYLESGDVGRSVQLEIEVIERARRAGDRRPEANAQMNLGYQYALLGLYKQARGGLEQALRMCEAIGDRTIGAYCLQDLGYVYGRSGDARTARRLEEQALRESTAVGDAFGRAAALQYLGFIAEQAGDYSLARARLAEARDGFGRLGVDAPGVEALAVQARCALAEGRLDEARQLAVEAWTFLREHGSKGIESPSRVYVIVADIFDALGAEEESRAAIEAGYGELMSRADKISNLEWRQSFLENVEEHRALIEMWERLSL